MPSDSILFRELLEANATGLIVSGDRRTPFAHWWLDATRGIRDVTKPGAEWTEYELVATDDPFEDALKYTVGIDTAEDFMPGWKYDVALGLGRFPGGKDKAYMGRNLTFTGRTRMQKDTDGVVRWYKVFEGSNRTKTKFDLHREE